MSAKDHPIASLCSLKTINNLLSYFLFKSDAIITARVLAESKNTYLSVLVNGFRSSLGGSMMDERDGDEDGDGEKCSTLCCHLPTSIGSVDSNNAFTSSKDFSQSKLSLKCVRHVLTISSE